MKACSLLVSLLFSLSSFSQIRIGEINSGGDFIAELNYSIENKDTVYTLMFTNQKHIMMTDIKAIRFTEEGGTLNSLFQILIENINAGTEKESTFSLGAEDVLIKSGKMSRVKCISFYTIENGAFFQLTKKQIYKLFNKKDT